jgi:perosamine synthetase
MIYPINRPYFDEDELTEVKNVLDSRWVTKGPKVEEFEEDIENYLGVKYAISVINCTSALHLALLALGIGKGDSVLVPSFTFPATAHAVLYCGASPIFVDVDSKTYNIKPSRIERKIKPNTRAIIPVHTFGQPCKMDKIIDISVRFNLKVVEDAACALGAKYKNQFAGTFGDIGCFSLHGRKGITTGEGGIVVTNEKEIAEKVRSLSMFGSELNTDNPEFIELGYNYKMSDITAAVGVAQLRKINKIIKRKQELARYYDELLQYESLITIPYVDKNVTPIYQSYVILLDKDINRDLVILKLGEKEIQTRFGTYACHIQPVYSGGDYCPVSLDLFNRSLALPLYPDLEFKDIRKIVASLLQCLEDLK